VWGFRDLRPWFDRFAEGDPIGEAWLTGDDCLIATGPCAGKKLGALFAEQPVALLGPNVPAAGSPLLVKVIFAREKLSVQVHPDDEMAQKYGQPRGKTECWYALAAEPEAKVALGFKSGVTLDEVKRGIHTGTLEASLNVLPVHTGDLVFVEAGTVHAIWPGAILLETQQYSDTTYRMYDYGRPRELHIEKSLEAVRFTTHAGKVAPRELADRTVLIDSGYFRIERIRVTGRKTGDDLCGRKGDPGLTYLFAASGAGCLSGSGFDPVDLPPRGMLAVPATSPEFMLEDVNGGDGCLEVIRITPNWPGKTS
jgi:mannose-6-phosphate isomerase